MRVYDLNPGVNKTPPNPADLKLGEVVFYGRKSTANEKSRAVKSLRDQKKCCEAVADKYDLPYDETSWREEPAGLGGGDWWEGGGLSGLEAPDAKRKVRWVLTSILREVIVKKTRAIVIWHQDRAWRDVALCRGMLQILFDYDCLLYDYNSGPINIWTYEGRNSVLQNAIAAQAVREAAQIASPRGVQQNIQDGKMVVSPNVLGFRTAGPRTCELKHIPEEQAIVLKMFHMSDSGMSNQEIADRLMADGVKLYSATGGKSPHGKKRLECYADIINNGTVRDILRDCRYIGKQEYVPKHVRDQWREQKQLIDPRPYQTPCEVFLKSVERDGEIVKEPVVPIEIWYRVQNKLDEQRRISNRALNQKTLTSLVRCGCDGKSLYSQATKFSNNNMVSYWIVKRHGQIDPCVHKLPCVREALLDDYLAEIMAPLMLAEINERINSQDMNTSLSRQMELERELADAEYYSNVTLYELSREKTLPRHLLIQYASNNSQDIVRIKEELTAIRAAIPTSFDGIMPTIKDLKSASSGAVRDAVRQCLCWVAIFACDPEREQKPKYKCDDYSYAPRKIGKIVFLTALGTYHTAVLYRERDGKTSGYPPTVLRPAQPHDVIGGVESFPNPRSFVEQLRHDWAAMGFAKNNDWCLKKYAPGYSPDGKHDIPVFQPWGEREVSSIS